MFLVVNKNDNIIRPWGNALEDDFVQFLPNHFKVEKEDLDIFYVDDQEVDKVTLGLNEYTIEIDLENRQFKVLQVIQGSLAGQLDPNNPEVVLEQDSEDLILALVKEPVAIKKMIKFPYDENGNFLGNEQALE